ncbi:MAG: glycosyltransferase family 2 protein [Nibricoccus sp.]
MSTAPDVSVIIPTYNRLWSLPRAVDSCRGTRCSTQIIVIDDGSTDGTWEWLQSQPDLIALRQDNQGQTWAVNNAFRSAQGRYIRFLDSDDFLSPGTIDLQFERAQETGAQLVYGRVDDFYQDSGRISQNPETPEWDDFIAVVLGEGYGSHYLGMLFARELFATVPPRRPDFALRDDRLFLHEIALLHPRIAATPGCAGYWVKHTAQMHTNYQGLQITLAAAQMLGIYRRTLNVLAKRGELTPRRVRAAVPIIWQAAHALAHTHLSDAAEAAAWCAQLQPGFVPPDSGPVRLCFRLLGYRMTHRILRLRRWILRRS